MHPVGWLSLRRLVVFFLELWSVLSFGPFFFVCLGASVTLRGGALGVPGGGVTLVAALWCCTWGRVREGAMAPTPLSTRFISHSATHSQTGPLWCCFPSGWACEAGNLSCCYPNPHGCFQSEVWGFISPCWSPGLRGLLWSPHFVWFICARMWGHRVCPWSDCLPRWSHTLPVSVLPRPRESSPPRCPSPPLLPVLMNVYFLFPWCGTPLPFDFLSVLVVRGGTVCLPTPPSWFSSVVYSLLFPFCHLLWALFVVTFLVLLSVRLDC